MPNIALLRRLENHLHHAAAPVHRTLCEHRLADRAHASARAHGQIKRPTDHNAAWHYPFAAARPVAPHTRGARAEGFSASALWGASAATSFVRHELPLLGLAAITQAGLPVQRLVDAYLDAAAKAAKPPRRAGDEVEGPVAPPRRRIDVTRLARAVFVAATSLEYLAGTAHTCAEHVHPATPALPLSLLERCRTVGLLGAGRAVCLQAADEARGRHEAAQEAALVGLAVGLGVLRLGVQLVGTAAMGVVAGLGAVGGLAYEAATRPFFWLAAGEAQSLGEVADAALARRLQRMHALGDDEHLGAPLIDILWKQWCPDGTRRTERAQAAWTMLTRLERAMGGAEAGFTHGGLDAAAGAAFAAAAAGAAPFAADARAEPRAAPTRAPAAAAEAPRADTANVHGIGRDAATRRALAQLLRQAPALDVPATLRAVREHLRALERDPMGPAHRRHPSGSSILQTARVALDGPQGRTFQLFSPISARTNTLMLPEDGHGAVPMARVLAAVWVHIHALAAADGLPSSTRALHAERRQALVAALARCVEDDGQILCAPGMAQRLVLVLQGFVAGIQIEAYDAPTPVAQFITMKAYGMAQALGDEPHDPAHVRRLFDEAYISGCAMYQGTSRAVLTEQLREMARLIYDLEDWVPPTD